MEDLRRNALKEYEDVREFEQKIVRQEKNLEGDIDQQTLSHSNELNKLYGSTNVILQMPQMELDDEEDNEAIEQLRELDAKEKKKLKKKQKKRDKKIK